MVRRSTRDTDHMDGYRTCRLETSPPIMRFRRDCPVAGYETFIRMCLE